MNRPLAESRRNQILAQLRRGGALRVTELAALLDAAPVTIRRDIRWLADQGIIRRVHGGAMIDTADPPSQAEAGPSGGAGSSLQIGMLVPSLDYYWPGVIQGAQAEAQERGIQLHLRGSSYDSTDDRAQITHLRDSGADGLLMAPDIASPAALETLAWLRAEQVPVVLVERELMPPQDHTPFESVTTDHRGGARTGVRYLAELGHRRIGLVVGLSPHADEVRRGWVAALAEGGLDQGVPDRELAQPGSVEALPVIDSIIDESLAGEVTALLIHADREAIAVAQRCQRRGIKIPDHLSIVSYDDEIVSVFSPPMTAVRPPRTSIGRAAVSLLGQRLRDPSRPAHRIQLSPKLSIRASAGPPPQGQAETS